jgi:hypothetical protein
LSSFNLLAQYVSISEILDANLFRLADGRVVKLAGVDVPFGSSSIPYLRKVADHSKSMINLYHHTHLSLDSISYNDSGDYLLVFLYRNYLIGKLNLSEKILDYGYGKYIKNFRSTDSTQLMFAENNAKEDQEGI